ncbi:MAG TPA: hypothetical protein VN999_14940 [Thermoanaerobaculia bacterium]|nr:hypothetical protein [Thermoanaerobaculia bacterium]
MTSLERLTRFVADLRYELLSVPLENRLAFIKERLATLPAEERRIAEDLVFIGADAMNQEVWNQKKYERLAFFAFGAFLVVAILVIALVVPNPTPSQAQTFRIILSLALTGAFAFIPGFLDVQIGKVVHASGALAIFVVIYFFNPAQVVISSLHGK